MSRILVLDQGSVEYIEHWGSDQRIIEAARMSTNKGFLGWGDGKTVGDEKLLTYLYTHKHMTPFEMAGAVLQIKAPIFIFREWHRHRTQSYNELSARYTPLPDENYLPTAERVLMGQVSSSSGSSGSGNRQAQAAAGSAVIFPSTAHQWLVNLESVYSMAQEVYAQGLELGVPKELARLCVPVGRYSVMRASANLRNWLAFLELRTAPNAQWEIQQYAKAVEELLRTHFPRTLALFNEHR